MNEYRVYDAADFGLYGMPAEGESYAVLAELENDEPNGRVFATYIGSGDENVPPGIDADASEWVDVDLAGKTPVFQKITVKDEYIVLEKQSELTEKQYEMLGEPLCVNTKKGRCDISMDHGRFLLEKDRTLQGITPVRLDAKKLMESIGEKYPNLLTQTHERYGNYPPVFPFGRYYEDREKMIVFVTRSQLPEISEQTLRGDIPFYKDGEIEWAAKNTYGVCVIDDRTDKYAVRLVRPDVALDMKREMERSLAEIDR